MRARARCYGPNPSGQFALESTNAYSGSLSDWSVLETLKEGGVLDIKVVVAEYLGVSC